MMDVSALQCVVGQMPRGTIPVRARYTVLIEKCFVQ